MNRELKRNAVISIIVHTAALLFFILYSFISCCRVSTRNISPFLDIQMGSGGSAPKGGGAAAASVPETDGQDDAFPQPVRKKSKGKVEVSKKLVKRQLKTSSVTQPKKILNENEIRRMLEKGVSTAPSSIPGSGSGSGTGTGGQYSPYALYFSQIRAIMYEAWQQPSSLIGKKGMITTVRLRVQRDGQITKKDITASSGNALMDDSVKSALETVSRLPELPPGLGGFYQDITVDFELTDLTVPGTE